MGPRDPSGDPAREKLTRQPVDVQSQGSMGTKYKKQGSCERRILSRQEFRNEFSTKAKGAETRKRGLRREGQGGSRGKSSAEGSAVLVELRASPPSPIISSAGLEGAGRYDT